MLTTVSDIIQLFPEELTFTNTGLKFKVTSIKDASALAKKILPGVVYMEVSLKCPQGTTSNVIIRENNFKKSLDASCQSGLSGTSTIADVPELTKFINENGLQAHVKGLCAADNHHLKLYIFFDMTPVSSTKNIFESAWFKCATELSEIGFLAADLSKICQLYTTLMGRNVTKCYLKGVWPTGDSIILQDLNNSRDYALFNISTFLDNYKIISIE